MDNDDDKVVTITRSDLDDTGTITIGDCLSDIDMSYSIKTGDTTWYSTYTAADSCTTDWLDTISFGDLTSKEVKVGNRTLTEDKVERLDAMLDVFEQDPEFAERLKTQIAFNRIKNENKSD